MASQKARSSRDNALFAGRVIVAFLALLLAAGHLSYTSSSGMSFPASGHNFTSANAIPSTGRGPGGFGGGFNAMGFWFDVEVIADVLIAMVFLLGLRFWYPLSVVFNAFNLGIYFLSGVAAIPGITQMAFPGRFDLFAGLTTINIIIVSWVAILIVGLLLWKYDPGSELDRLLGARKQ